MRALVLASLVGVFASFVAAPAEARLFEPQANWWSSGSTCATARNPPGRRWRALPPRSCARSTPGRNAEMTLPAQAAQVKGKAASEAA
jgi:hypothetical protein